MNKAAGQSYFFGEFELNSAKRSLLRSGQPLALNSKAFDLLATLVENHGQIVSKNTLLETVWEGQFVEENNLTVHISALRKAINDTGNPKRFISTVPGKGYSFVADVVTESEDSEIIYEQRSVSRIVVEEYSSDNGAVIQPQMLIGGSRRGFGNIFAVVGLVSVAVLVGLGAFFAQQRFGSNKEAFRDVTSRRLTNKGDVHNAALSRNGKLFVYSTGQPRSLRIGQTDGGQDIELIAPSDVIYRALAFSPDDESIYYVVTGKGHPKGSMLKMRVLGGVAEKVRDDVRSHVAFSPDVNQFAFVGKSEDGEGSSLYIASTFAQDKRALVTRSNKFQFDSSSVAWSRDGKTIAIAAISDKGEGVNREVFLVGVEDGQIRQLTTHKFRNVGGLAWLGDGSGLTMIGAEHTEINAQMWHVSTTDGSVRRINQSLTNYGSPMDLSSDSSSMMAITSDSMTNLWVAPTDAPERAKQITTSAFGGAYARVGIAWLADGRIVATGHSNAGGNPLWITDSEGKTIKQLTPNNSIDTSPSATADGQTVVFNSNRSGALEIWRIDLVSNDLKQLTFGGYNDQPSVSPDGKWVVYISEIDGARTVWRVPLAGGAAEKIANGEASWVRVSPDSQFIACAYEVDGKTRLAVLSISGGEPVKVFELAAAANLRYSLRWTPDGRWLTYRDWENGYWRQSIDGGTPQRISGFPEEKLFSYDWSPDGKQIVFGRGPEIRDVILVRNAE